MSLRISVYSLTSLGIPKLLFSPTRINNRLLCTREHWVSILCFVFFVVVFALDLIFNERITLGWKCTYHILWLQTVWNMKAHEIYIYNFHVFRLSKLYNLWMIVPWKNVWKKKPYLFVSMLKGTYGVSLTNNKVRTENLALFNLECSHRVCMNVLRSVLMLPNKICT